VERFATLTVLFDRPGTLDFPPVVAGKEFFIQSDLSAGVSITQGPFPRNHGMGVSVVIAEVRDPPYSSLARVSLWGLSKPF
jgi:hypothetical protein